MESSNHSKMHLNISLNVLAGPGILPHLDFWGGHSRPQGTQLPLKANITHGKAQSLPT